MQKNFILKFKDDYLLKNIVSKYFKEKLRNNIS